jgi:hypothetical protein
MRGRLHLILSDRDGRPVAERRATNTVMRSGAAIVAELFLGQGQPVTHMAVGVSDADPDDTGRTALSNEAFGSDPPLTGATRAQVSPGSIVFDTDDVKRQVRVRMRATLPNDASVGKIREAGLVALVPAADPADPPTERLYNRVTFAPIEKGDDHELTLFWEVEFPFGDLSFSF